MSPGGVEYGKGLRCSDTTETLLSVKEVAMSTGVGMAFEAVRAIAIDTHSPMWQSFVEKMIAAGCAAVVGKAEANWVHTLTDPDALDAIVNRSARGGTYALDKDGHATKLEVKATLAYKAPASTEPTAKPVASASAEPAAKLVVVNPEQEQWTMAQVDLMDVNEHEGKQSTLPDEISWSDLDELDLSEVRPDDLFELEMSSDSLFDDTGDTVVIEEQLNDSDRSIYLASKEAMAQMEVDDESAGQQEQMVDELFAREQILADY